MSRLVISCASPSATKYSTSFKYPVPVRASLSCTRPSVAAKTLMLSISTSSLPATISTASARISSHHASSASTAWLYGSQIEAGNGYGWPMKADDHLLSPLDVIEALRALVVYAGGMGSSEAHGETST